MSKETTINNDDNVFSGWEKPDDIDFFDKSTDKVEEAEEVEDVDNDDNKNDKPVNVDADDDDDSSDDGSKKDKKDKEEQIDFFGESEDSDEEEEEQEEEDEKKKPEQKSSKIETLNYLKEKGLIDFELEEGQELTDDNAEDILADSFESSIDNTIKDMMDGLPPTTKSLVEFALKGGNETEFLSELNKAGAGDVQITKDLDLKEEKNQKAVITADLKSQGYDDDYIDTQLDFLKDSGKMESMSEKVHDRIVKKQDKIQEGKVKEAADRKERMKKNQREFKSKISERLKEAQDLSGLKLTDKHKKELPSYMSDPTVKTQDGEVSKFQHDLFQALQDENKSMLLARIVHGDFDLSDIANSAVSKQTKDIKKDVRRTKTKNPTSSGSSQKKARKALADYFN